MRIWSISPKYLDTKGLVALWRESLLAKHVLITESKGYRNHPQLLRFKSTPDPEAAINSYLVSVLKESQRRGFNFNKSKIGETRYERKIPLRQGQIGYEFNHLLKKLIIRDNKKYGEIKDIETIEVVSLFEIIPGGIESWEKIK